jgi:hypothetical protein
MRAAAKADILPFRPVNRDAGREKAPPKRGLFARLTRFFGEIFRRRRQARLRSQLQVIHRWERARKA